MADAVLEVEARLKDYISGELNKISGQFSKFDKAAKSANNAMQAQDKALNSLARRFLGIGAIIMIAQRSFVYLSSAAKEAGLETKGIDDAMGKLKATVGAEVLPVFQDMADTIAKHTDTIVKIPTIAIRGIVSIANIGTSSILTITATAIEGFGKAKKYIDEVISRIKNDKTMKFSPGISDDPNDAKNNAAQTKTYWEAYAEGLREQADAAFKNAGVDKLFDGTYFDVDIKKPKAKQAGGAVQPNAEEVSPWIREANKAFMKAQYDVLYSIDMQGEAYLHLGELMYDTLAIDVETTKKELENSELRIQQAKKEQEAKNNYNLMVYEETAHTLTMVGQATKASAQQQKGLAKLEATVMGASAIVRTLNDPTIPSTYARMAMAAIIATQTAAQIALISKQSFARGGIVGGSSFAGDRVAANVNSGEMILNRQQQANLFGAINNNTMTKSGTVVNINIPQGASVDMAAADRIEQMANIIGDVIQKAEYDGRLERIKPLLRR